MPFLLKYNLLYDSFKTMRMLLFLVLVFIPMQLYAANPCIGQDSETCKMLGGCYWENSCKQCGQGMYCEPGAENYQNCPSPYSNSDAGAESINECYTDIQCLKPNNEAEQCRHYYDQTVSNCPTITTPHLESNGGSISCYADTRECKYFGIAANSCTQQNISGTANWHLLSEDWGVGNCQCGATTFTDSTTRFCSGTLSGVHPQTTTVEYATSAINYNGTASGYNCTRCIQDNGNNKYYASSDNGDGCVANLQSGTVCKCETSPYYGHYRTGKCCTSANDCPEWGNATNICRRIPCDIPGTTTTELLPTSTDNSVCKYTRDTILADPVDDFTLGNIEDTYGISVDGWISVP